MVCQNKVEFECCKNHKNLLNSNLVDDSYLQNTQLEGDGILESAWLTNINKKVQLKSSFFLFFQACYCNHFPNNVVC